MSIDLDAIKARLAKACPGPWVGGTLRDPLSGDCLMFMREDDPTVIAATLRPQYGDNDTAAMLLHSRADMDALVAEVERLWCRVDDLERAREFVRMKASLHERAAVVEYLRAPGTSCDPNVLADAFERGEHLEER